MKMKIKTIASTILMLIVCFFTMHVQAQQEGCYINVNYTCENANDYTNKACYDPSDSLITRTSGGTSTTAIQTNWYYGNVDESNADGVCTYTISTNSCLNPYTFVLEQTVNVTNIVLVAYGPTCPVLAKKKTDSLLVAQADTEPAANANAVRPSINLKLSMVTSGAGGFK